LDHKTRIDQEVGKVTYVKPRVESAQHGWLSLFHSSLFLPWFFVVYFTKLSASEVYSV
jgi:hypothetical protein